MSQLLDAILEASYQVRNARGMKLVVSREVFIQLKRESEEHLRRPTKLVIDDSDPQPNSFLGMPIEVSPDIEGWEIHQGIPKEPR